MSGPDFGPGGYLPQKAAKRARKIVLREQMGFGWPLAAAGAALVVVVAGVLFLRSFNQPPGEPFAPVASLSDVPAGGATAFQSGPNALVIVRASGSVRVFVGRDDIIWCAESQRLEAPGASWTADGRRAYGDGPGLQPLQSVVFDGEIYVDSTSWPPVPPPAPSDDPPACVRTD